MFTRWSFVDNVMKEILDLLAEKGAMTAVEIKHSISCPESTLAYAIFMLIDKKAVSVEQGRETHYYVND